MAILRQLPPVATPLSVGEWWAGWAAPRSRVAEFGAAASRTVGGAHGWAASSGRTALRLLLDALRADPRRHDRDEVVLPGYTCPSVAKVVLDAGLTPRLVDLDPATLTYVTGGVTQATGRRTLAVLVVHPFGLPVALDEALAAAQAAGAALIEDAAQAMGATLAGRHVGTHGTAGLYSFGPGKPLALGGGGMIVSADAELAQALSAAWTELAAVGQVGALWRWARMALFTLAFRPPLWWAATQVGAQRIGDQEVSWGYRLDGLSPGQAAVGLRLLPRLDAINAARRRNGQRLAAALAGVPRITLPCHAGTPEDAIYLRFPLLADTPTQADRLARRLVDAGLGAGRMYRRTLPEFLPQLGGTPLPGAARVARTLLTLPTHFYVQERDLERVAALAAAETAGAG
jgi:dTDP-4-amino-4,6-dideoxygalactose transaminase